MPGASGRGARFFIDAFVRRAIDIETLIILGQVSDQKGLLLQGPFFVCGVKFELIFSL